METWCFCFDIILIMIIYFITGNARKVGEAKLACESAGIEIIQKKLDIDEIQSTNPSTISIDKAEKAYELVKKPLVVTDSFWRIPALNGFPGAYMKDVANWFTSEDFLSLMEKKDNRQIFFSENITYKDAEIIKQFSQEYEGIIVSEPRGTGNSIENVAEFEGFTLGERREQGGYSHKPEDYVWNDFVKWINRQ